jgi:hypothetical protein
MLRTAAAAGLGVIFPAAALGRDDAGQSAVLAYLSRLARSDGGYSWWEDQPQSHLTPTFAAVGCYRLLKHDPPDKDKLTRFIRDNHPFRIKKLERDLRVFEYQQIQSLLWLGEDVSAFRDVVLRWTKPAVYPKQYEQHGYPVFRLELTAFTCRRLLGLPLDDLAPQFFDYLMSRRRANGSFNNTPASDGGDGHVMNTWWGFEALRALGREVEKPEKIIAWLRDCQLPNGGFTYQPQASIGGVDDVAYTWAAVRALKQLQAAPANREACLRYLGSLANADGGFGDRPGWASNPMATYYALDALDVLAAALVTTKPTPRRDAALPADLQVFSIQIEAHGQGSPAEAVDLARALRIHLWGAKNAKPQWIKHAQALADRQKVPVTFFVANEEYGTWVNVPGMGTYSHTSDILAPAGSDFGPSLANKGAVSWPEFAKKRLAPLHKAEGRLVWQFGENEELTRIFLDESLQHGGFAAISTFHFGNPDFTNSEPFLQRYRHQLPFLALQDAHGSEPWWFADMTTGFRTLFLARAATWDDWLTALQRNWVAAIRHDAVSRFQTWMHGGSRAVLDFVRRHERDWRWWDNPKIQRPLVSIVAVRPSDEFEAARPDKGIMIRVRCAWQNTAQGFAKKPIAELVKLIVDGTVVAPKLVATKRPRGTDYVDYHHQFHLPEPAPGQHRVQAVIRTLETKEESSRAIEFTV